MDNRKHDTLTSWTSGEATRWRQGGQLHSRARPPSFPHVHASPPVAAGAGAILALPSPPSLPSPPCRPSPLLHPQVAAPPSPPLPPPLLPSEPGPAGPQGGAHAAALPRPLLLPCRGARRGGCEGGGVRQQARAPPACFPRLPPPALARACACRSPAAAPCFPALPGRLVGERCGRTPSLSLEAASLGCSMPACPCSLPAGAAGRVDGRPLREDRRRCSRAVHPLPGAGQHAPRHAVCRARGVGQPGRLKAQEIGIVLLHACEQQAGWRQAPLAAAPPHQLPRSPPNLPAPCCCPLALLTLTLECA